MNQIHALYLATDTLHVMKSVDTEKALRKVKGRMNKKRISWWEWTQRIAAMLSIPLLIAVLWMYQDKDEQQEVAGIFTRLITPNSLSPWLLTYICTSVSDTDDVETFM